MTQPNSFSRAIRCTNRNKSVYRPVIRCTNRKKSIRLSAQLVVLIDMKSIRLSARNPLY